jgi:hypothetical protein
MLRIERVLFSGSAIDINLKKPRVRYRCNDNESSLDIRKYMRVAQLAPDVRTFSAALLYLIWKESYYIYMVSTLN